MKTATKIRDIEGWTGSVALYKLSEPLEGAEFVSGTNVPFSGPETYIFPAADADAEDPSSWGELEGSFRGAIDHERALRGAGYEVVA